MENYKKALGLLTSAQKFRIKLGLERINALLALLGSPHKNLNVIHVAGTNGKGSVCAILSSVFAAAGYKTGLYTSPHLVSYTERIKINNKPVDEEKFAQLVCEICDIAQKNNIEPTEFEVLTAAMFKYFHDEGAEICIVETGLGGRFDATNVLENPVCSIITSISKDHTERLGNTIDQIAFEKAGIIKQNSKVICESENAGFEVIKNAAQSRNAQLFTPSNDVSVEFTGGRNFAGIDGKTYEFGLIGQYQEGNLRLALEAIRQSGLKISEKALASGLEKVFHPCRIQYLSEKKLIIDGAHNPDGAKRWICILEMKKNCGFLARSKIKIMKKWQKHFSKRVMKFLCVNFRMQTTLILRKSPQFRPFWSRKFLQKRFQSLPVHQKSLKSLLVRFIWRAKFWRRTRI